MNRLSDEELRHFEAVLGAQQPKVWTDTGHRLLTAYREVVEENRRLREALMLIRDARMRIGSTDDGVRSIVTETERQELCARIMRGEPVVAFCRLTIDQELVLEGAPPHVAFVGNVVERLPKEEEAT